MLRCLFDERFGSLVGGHIGTMTIGLSPHVTSRLQVGFSYLSLPHDTKFDRTVHTNVTLTVSLMQPEAEAMRALW